MGRNCHESKRFLVLSRGCCTNLGEEREEEKGEGERRKIYMREERGRRNDRRGGVYGEKKKERVRECNENKRRNRGGNEGGKEGRGRVKKVTPVRR